MALTNIFVCCRREDLSVVQKIVVALEEDSRLRVHMDKWHLLPGGAWVEEIDQILDKCTVCAFFLGLPYYHSGLVSALADRVSERTLRVIPISLPGGTTNFYNLPPLLKAEERIEFRRVEDEWAFRQLKERILGQKVSSRPDQIRLPVDILDLELLETYLKQKIAEGAVDDAANIYAFQFGGYRHLGWHLGDYNRGLRLTSLLVDAGGIGLQGSMAVRPAYEQSLFYMDTGQPQLAETKLRELLEYYHGQVRRQEEIRRMLNEREVAEEQLRQIVEEHARFHRWLRGGAWLMYESALLQSIGDALVLQGKLVEAEKLATAVIEQINTDDEQDNDYFHPGFIPYGRRAVARFLLGQPTLALSDFQHAQALSKHVRRQEASNVYQQLWYARFLVCLGKVKTANSLLQQYRIEQLRRLRPLLAAQFELVLAEYYLAILKDSRATSLLDSALAWSTQSKHQDTFARVNLLKGRCLLRRGNHKDAQIYLEAAEQTCRLANFNLLLVDTLILQGYAAMYEGKFEEAKSRGQEAYNLSIAGQCGYRWGSGSAAQLLAEIACGQEDFPQALDWASQAYLTRHEIEDPRFRNTRQLMKRIGQRVA